MEPMKIDFPGGKRVDAHFNGFTVMTDQREYAGGEGSAPQPFDFFPVSLGTCAGIYVLVFCQTRDIPTEDISLTLTMEKEPGAKLISCFRIRLNLPPSFPEKYHKAIVRAADMCTVAKHLLDPPEVVVEVAVAEGS